MVFSVTNVGNAVRHTGELLRIAHPEVVAYKGRRIADSF